MSIDSISPAHRSSHFGQAVWVRQHNFAAHAASPASFAPPSVQFARAPDAVQASEKAAAPEKIATEKFAVEKQAVAKKTAQPHTTSSFSAATVADPPTAVIEADAAAAAAAKEDTPAFEVKVKGRTDRSLFPTNTVKMGVDDIIDIINPLQHLPLVGDLYRAATGDEVSPMAKIMGAFIYGGVAGGMIAHASTVYEDSKGQSPTESVLAALAPEQPTAKAQTVMQAARQEGADLVSARRGGDEAKLHKLKPLYETLQESGIPLNEPRKLNALTRYRETALLAQKPVRPAEL